MSNLTPEELYEEKDYLRKVLEVIQGIINDSGISIEQKKKEINELKKYIWDYSSEMDEVEMAASMSEVDGGVGYANKTIRELEKLKKSLNSPYFGRIDFKLDRESDPIYIGLNSVMKDFVFYVYDWRTPIASLFYNYGTGQASYQAPKGRIDGEIELKRQYKIVDGKLQRCFNSDMNIDDDYLQEILSNSSSDRMVNIVNSIQSEQNNVIRNDKDKILVVQGTAGSGKTSVALHRIAYLLYRDKSLGSKNILILSPNELFSEYISNVLPELGEENVMQTTFSDFASAYLKDFKNIESFTSFVERFYDGKHDEREFLETRFKCSNDYSKLLSEYLKNYISNVRFTRGFSVNNNVITINGLNDWFQSRFSKISPDKRFELIAESICEDNRISIKKYAKIIVSKLKENTTCSLNPLDIYNSFLSSSEYKALSGVESSNFVSKKRKLKYEDLLSLLFIKFELEGYPKSHGIKHVIVDECQDYSLLQYQLLRKVFQDSSFTILGDLNQTINPYYKYNSLEEILELFGSNGRFIELSKSYRSSQEIIDYTNKLLGLKESSAVRRENNIPVTIREVTREETIPQLMSDIELMKQNGMNRIAIITKNNTETSELYDELKIQTENIQKAMEGQRQEIGVPIILPSYISKGLEFDGVIAYNSKEDEYSEEDANLFYVVCTRAQHDLRVYNEPGLVKRLENK